MLVPLSSRFSPSIASEIRHLPALFARIRHVHSHTPPGQRSPPSFTSVDVITRGGEKRFRGPLRERPELVSATRPPPHPRSRLTGLLSVRRLYKLLKSHVYVRSLPKCPFVPQSHRAHNTVPLLPPCREVRSRSWRPEASKLEAPVSRPVASSMELDGSQLFLTSLYSPGGPSIPPGSPFQRHLPSMSTPSEARCASHHPGVLKLEAPAPRPSSTSSEPAPPLTPFLGGTALEKLPSANGAH